MLIKLPGTNGRKQNYHYFKKFFLKYMYLFLYSYIYTQIQQLINVCRYKSVKKQILIISDINYINCCFYELCCLVQFIGFFFNICKWLWTKVTLNLLLNRKMSLLWTRTISKSKFQDHSYCFNQCTFHQADFMNTEVKE